MSNLRPFQIVLLGVFIAFAVGGLILFSVYRGFGTDPNPYGARVVIRGTLDERPFREAINTLSDADDNFKIVSYVRKNESTFENELVNAIAEGRGPDAVVISNELLISVRAKLYPISYDALPERTIKDTYVDGAEIFSLSDGTYGLPFAVDPLVMYWNRDLFATAGLATPPATWEALVASTVPALTHRATDSTFVFTQEALAFGEYANVTHASDVMMMLLLQAGSPLITEYVNGYAAALNQAVGQTARPPLDAALDFYTQFANPSRTTYTWNRSLPQDRAAFLAGDLALYFAPGSESSSLRAGNPNLNFDAAQIPQGSSVTVKKGFGTFYALSILTSGKNIQGTYQALSVLGADAEAGALASGLGFAPVHRDVLAAGTANPIQQTTYRAALIARGFLNPNPAGSEGVIKTMIEDVTSGRERISEAARDAVGRFNLLLQ